jgi:hypothetical protein
MGQLGFVIPMTRLGHALGFVAAVVGLSVPVFGIAAPAELHLVSSA